MSSNTTPTTTPTTTPPLEPTVPIEPEPVPGPGIQWTYNGDPLNSLSDRVRFKIGDVDGRDPLLSDNEVAYLLAVNDNDAQSAAIEAIRSLIPRMARLVDETVGSVSISLSQRTSNLKDILSMLLSEQSRTSAMDIFVGGIDRCDKDIRRRDFANVAPIFTLHDRNEYGPDSYPRGRSGDNHYDGEEYL